MTSLPSTAQIDKARNMKLPDKIYFHIFDGGKFGLVIRELSVCDAGSLEKAAQSIDDDTVSFHLLEDGVLTDASEDVALEWMRLNRDTIEFLYDQPCVPAFIAKHCSEALDDLAGEITCARLNELRHNEHQFSRAS